MMKEKKGGLVISCLTQALIVSRFVLPGLAVFISLSLPASAQDLSPPPAVVWFTDHHNLIHVDPTTHQITLSIALPAESETLAVDPADGSVWAGTDRQLRKYDRSGILKQELDLRSASSKLDETKYLLLNPHDSSLWVASERVVMHLDSSGRLIGKITLSGKIRSLALDLDERLWLIAGKQLVRLAPNASILSTHNLQSLLPEAQHLAVDRLGKRLWLAGHGELLALDTANLAQPLLRIALAAALQHPGKAGESDRESEDDNKIDALAVHPVFGTVWVVVKQTLLIYDRQGQPLKQVPLASHDLGEIEAMVFDPVGFGLWLGGNKALGHFQSNGVFVARVPVQNELQALAAAPFRLRPTLSLLAPTNGIVTNNVFTPLRYALGADCTGTPCLLDPDYTRSFQLNVDLNGLSIGRLFTFTPDAVLYQSPYRLPEGINRLTAQATDRYGHVSEKISSQFIVDTLPPRFVSISPADGSTVTRGTVTIQGSVDDATASVMLADAAGSVISIGGARFAFDVILKQGWNVFTLVARDAAGNPTSTPLRLYLNTLEATLTDPLPGSTVGTDSLVLSGTFKGPENTGITVNGIAAFTDGQHFYVNNLPLNLGANTLTITITGPDGQTTSQTVTVRSSSPSPLKVEVDPQVGLAPHTTHFTIGYNGTGTVTRYTLDVDGDGVVDDTGTDIALPREYTYTAPGVYRSRVTLTDSTGKTYDQTLAVLVQDPARVDAFFTTLWSGMNTALTSGDITQAAGYLNQSAKRKYTPVFEALKPNFLQIVASYSPLQRLSVSETIGEYAVQRAANGQNRVYLIYFLKDTDGVWRVDEM